MPVSAKLYGKAFANAFGGETAGESNQTDWLTDEIRVCLLTNSYTPAQDTHEFYSDVSSYEHAGTGNYTVGGQALQSKTVTYTAGTKTNSYGAANVSWATSTISAAYAAIYNYSNSAKPLIAYVDFSAVIESHGGAFTIQWAADGIFKVVVS